MISLIQDADMETDVMLIEGDQTNWAVSQGSHPRKSIPLKEGKNWDQITL